MPGKNVSNWNSLAKKNNPWSISSNFWQIILTEYFVQIYNTFEPWQGWAHLYEYSPKVTTFQNTIISQCWGKLFFLTDFLCMSGSWGHQQALRPIPASPRASSIPAHSPGAHFTQPSPWSSCGPHSLSPVTQPQPFLLPREVSDARDGLPNWVLGWGLAASPCPDIPESLRPPMKLPICAVPWQFKCKNITCFLDKGFFEWF